MPKIFCIDDTPDSPEIGGKTLREVLSNIYQSTPYNVLFEVNGEKGVEIARGDKDIKLVLLDIEFTKQREQGDKIALKLARVRPDLKVIVLTRESDTGYKISFGHKKNVVHYVIKKHISSPDIQEYMRNLSEGIIEDFDNKRWQLEYDGYETITLTKGTETFGINIPLNAKGALQDCLKFPNKAELLTDPFYLNKAHNMINKNVLEKTKWKTWGILSKEDCAKGQLKLKIGSVASLPITEEPKTAYVTQTEFEKLLSDFKSFKAEMLSKLNDIKVTKRG